MINVRTETTAPQKTSSVAQSMSQMPLEEQTIHSRPIAEGASAASADHHLMGDVSTKANSGTRQIIYSIAGPAERPLLPQRS